jgi:hypothetical protein
MTAVLQKFKAYGLGIEGAIRPKARQVLELHIAAANTDIAYDFGDIAGTFWVGALADTTYGGLADDASVVLLTKIAGVLGEFLGIKSSTLWPRIQVASGATGTQYVAEVASGMPELTFVSGDAPTTMVLVLEWTLKDGASPVVADYGSQV